MVCCHLVMFVLVRLGSLVFFYQKWLWHLDSAPQTNYIPIAILYLFSLLYVMVYSCFFIIRVFRISEVLYWHRHPSPALKSPPKILISHAYAHCHPFFRLSWLSGADIQKQTSDLHSTGQNVESSLLFLIKLEHIHLMWQNHSVDNLNTTKEHVIQDSF